MALWSGSLCLLCLSVLSNQLWYTEAINSKICLSNIPRNQGKNFPDIPNSFEASFAWNSLGDNTTFFVRETFSQDMNIGIMLVEDLLGPGVQSKLYTYGHTNEFIYIPDYDGTYGGSCVAGDLAYNDFAFPFSKVSGKDHLVSGKDVLMMGANSAAMIYKGTDTIDDIDVDVWNACLYVADTDMTINATYYFTLNTTDGNRWKTASGLTSSIKRIHMIQDNSKETNPSESIHEYYYFSNHIFVMTPDNIKYLEPPLGAYCENRKTNKALPTVPDYFSFYMEVVDPKSQLVTYTDEWYDYTSNLSRIDHNEKQDRTNVSKPIKIIHDYATGLSYRIHMYTGDCQIKPILADSFDNEVIPGGQGLVRMRNPKEFFNYDNADKYKWVYEGTHVVRGVECEVWISKRPYPTEDAPDTGFWEWYFTNSQWTLSTGDVIENMEPFKMVITVPAFKLKTEFNFYNFNEEPPNDRYFDISECFDQHNMSRTYGYVMRADVNKYKLDKNVEMLKYWTSFSIEASAGIRAMRIHDIRFEFDGKQVFTEFTVLGTPNNVVGDVANPLLTMTLSEAENALITAIRNETFTVYFMTQDGKEIHFSVDKSSLSKMIRDKNHTTYYVISEDGKDFLEVETKYPAVPAGGVAAIVIVMLIVGVALVAVPFAIITRRKKDLKDFNRSQLTMSDMAGE